MSLRAFSWAMEVTCPTPTAKLVLLALADAHNGHSGDCYPSLARIIKTTGLSESGVKGAIRALEADGLLSRTVETDHTGRTKGVRYDLKCDEGRGRQETPRGREETPEGASGNPTRRRQETPLIKNLEKEPGKEQETLSASTDADAGGEVRLPAVRPKKRLLPADYPDDAFEAHFWPAYPLKKGKAEAAKAFLKAAPKVPFAELMAGVRRYAATRLGEDPSKTKHAQGWLNGERWADEHPTGAPHGQQATRNGRTYPAAQPAGTASRLAAIMGYDTEPDLHGPAEERRVSDRSAWPQGRHASGFLDAEPDAAGVYRA